MFFFEYRLCTARKGGVERVIGDVGGRREGRGRGGGEGGGGGGGGGGERERKVKI
jgi:hypothetical protein